MTIWHRVYWDDDCWTTDVIPKAGSVLVTTNWGAVALDTIVETKDGLAFDFYTDVVVAWAYLPDPYKEVEPVGTGETTRNED